MIKNFQKKQMVLPNNETLINAGAPLQAAAAPEH